MSLPVRNEEEVDGDGDDGLRWLNGELLRRDDEEEAAIIYMCVCNVRDSHGLKEEESVCICFIYGVCVFRLYFEF